MACDPVEEARDSVVCTELHGGLERRLLPAGAGLEPEDGGGDGLASLAGGLAEQAFGDCSPVTTSALNGEIKRRLSQAPFCDLLPPAQGHQSTS
jgi:hypothetical protein